MGYLEALVNASIRDRGSEGSLFFPCGRCSPGYVLSTTEIQRAKKTLKQYYAISHWLILVAVITYRTYALWLLVILLPWYAVIVQQIVRGKPRSLDRFSTTESMTAMASSMDVRTRLLLLLGSILMLIASAIVFLKTDRKLLGLSGVLFTSIGLIVSLRLLQLAFRKGGQKIGDNH
jgi:hypothetical protein